jgi:hypothetical protein
MAGRPRWSGTATPSPCPERTRRPCGAEPASRYRRISVVRDAAPTETPHWPLCRRVEFELAVPGEPHGRPSRPRGPKRSRGTLEWEPISGALKGGLPGHLAMDYRGCSGGFGHSCPLPGPGALGDRVDRRGPACWPRWGEHLPLIRRWPRPSRDRSWLLRLVSPSECQVSLAPTHMCDPRGGRDEHSIRRPSRPHRQRGFGVSERPPSPT